ncbi:MAG: hypothetical protein IJ418_16640 [Clostridia bacterium]|nr:hypothetical protein [Clostridia bacterium]
MLHMTKLGCTISLPWGSKDRYDQIWDVDGRLIRVQIKTARAADDQHSGIIFNCYTVSNGTKHFYSKNEIDYFATYWNEKVYLVPIDECSCQKNLRFFSTSKYTNLSAVNWASDYEVEKVLGITDKSRSAA